MTVLELRMMMAVLRIMVLIKNETSTQMGRFNLNLTQTSVFIEMVETKEI